MQLNERQAAFAQAIWHEDGAPEIGVRPAARFAVYRNNVFAGLSSVIEARYPVIRRLVGDDCFRGCALRFVAEFPPRSPVLNEYGEAFADFLAKLPELSALRYLPDVARLEWARHATLHAADAPVLYVEMLAGITAERVADLIFQVHPSTCLLRSAYPVHAIWQTNSVDAETRVISADVAGEAVLVSRRDETVSMLPLDLAACAFVDMLRSGQALGAAVAAAHAVEDSFDFAPVLATLLRADAFTAYGFNA